LRLIEYEKETERWEMTELTLQELERVRLRRQKRKAKSKRRRSLETIKMAKEKIILRKKRAAKKKRL
jgi:hypothetical protein